ncbi:hypothetical protein LFL96_07270 [Paraburkholderia sp. D15]|uniref:hypothetical protein n=1 Tax=Paraburkholderia sp. D15 TaxID=2880218 RepID=UPI0024794EA1|nr:hypothetical protein [Paraburkholderia sp. D15]WGS51295.1 hypothetical protein LFL96_07270 [Paraburkholderia sp. D15]
MITKRKKSRLAGDIGLFVQQYSRKAQKGIEPNDRQYDHKIEQKLKRLSPLDLSDLLLDEDEYVEPSSDQD